MNKKKPSKTAEDNRIYNAKYYQDHKEELKEEHKQNYHLTKEGKFDKIESKLELRISSCLCLDCFKESRETKKNCHCFIDCIRESSCNYSCPKKNFI